MSYLGVAKEQTGWRSDKLVFDSLLHDLGRVEQKSSICYSIASGEKWVEIMDVMVVQVLEMMMVVVREDFRN